MHLKDTPQSYALDVNWIFAVLHQISARFPWHVYSCDFFSLLLYLMNIFHFYIYNVFSLCLVVPSFHAFSLQMSVCLCVSFNKVRIICSELRDKHTLHGALCSKIFEHVCIVYVFILRCIPFFLSLPSIWLLLFCVVGFSCHSKYGKSNRNNVAQHRSNMSVKGYSMALLRKCQNFAISYEFWSDSGGGEKNTYFFLHIRATTWNKRVWLKRHMSSCPLLLVSLLHSIARFTYMHVAKLQEIF